MSNNSTYENITSDGNSTFSSTPLNNLSLKNDENQCVQLNGTIVDISFATDKTEVWVVVFLIGIYCVVVELCHIYNRFYTTDPQFLDQFFDAGGSVSSSMCAISVASQMYWPMYHTRSAVMVVKYGIAGGFWSCAGRVASLLLFPALSHAIKTRAPGAKTYLQVIRIRFGPPCHIMFIFFSLGVSFTTMSTLISSGGELVKNLVTPVTSKEFYVPIIMALSCLAPFVGGLRTTIYTKYVCFLTIAVCTLTYGYSFLHEWTVDSVQDLQNVIESCLKVEEDTNTNDSFFTFRSNALWHIAGWELLLMFSYTFCSQTTWQCRIASKPKDGAKGIILGAFMWFAIPFTMGTATGLVQLFLFASPEHNGLSEGLVEKGFVPVYVIQQHGVLARFTVLLVVMGALLSVMSGEVMAVTSIFVFDIYSTYYAPFRSKCQPGHCKFCKKQLKDNETPPPAPLSDLNMDTIYVKEDTPPPPPPIEKPKEIKKKKEKKREPPPPQIIISPEESEASLEARAAHADKNRKSILEILGKRNFVAASTLHLATYSHRDSGSTIDEYLKTDKRGSRKNTALLDTPSVNKPLSPTPSARSDRSARSARSDRSSVSNRSKATLQARIASPVPSPIASKTEQPEVPKNNLVFRKVTPIHIEDSVDGFTCRCPPFATCTHCADDIAEMKRGIGRRKSWKLDYNCPYHGLARLYEYHLICLSRACTLVVCVLLIVFQWTLHAASVRLNLWLYLYGGMLTAPVAAGIILSTCWTKTTRQGMIVGTLLGVVAGFLGNTIAAFIKHDVHLIGFLNMTSELDLLFLGAVLGFWVSLLLNIAISVASKKDLQIEKERERLRDIDNPMCPWADKYDGVFETADISGRPLWRELKLHEKPAAAWAYVFSPIALLFLCGLLPALLAFPAELLDDGFAAYVITAYTICFALLVVTFIVAIVRETCGSRLAKSKTKPNPEGGSESKSGSRSGSANLWWQNRKSRKGTSKMEESPEMTT